MMMTVTVSSVITEAVPFTSANCKFFIPHMHLAKLLRQTPTDATTVFNKTELHSVWMKMCCVGIKKWTPKTLY